MARNAYIIAGPNGAGKTTFATEFLPHYADCRNFINADFLAQGLSPLAPEAAAFRAGMLMLREIHEHMEKGVDFAFESTLAGRSHIRLFRQLKRRGYRIHVYYLWIPSVDLALSRIRTRVMSGGHDVPVPVVHRRYWRSLRSFFSRYSKLASTWMLFDNSGAAPIRIASMENRRLRILHPDMYNRISKGLDSL
jgi:predicted ABC-type ATPase